MEYQRVILSLGSARVVLDVLTPHVTRRGRKILVRDDGVRTAQYIRASLIDGGARTRLQIGLAEADDGPRLLERLQGESELRALCFVMDGESHCAVRAVHLSSPSSSSYEIEPTRGAPREAFEVAFATSRRIDPTSKTNRTSLLIADRFKGEA